MSLLWRPTKTPGKSIDIFNIDIPNVYDYRCPWEVSGKEFSLELKFEHDEMSH